MEGQTTVSRTQHKPTPEQEEIVEGTSNLQYAEVAKLVAYAGAAKTTTLEMIAFANRMPTAYLAFNSSIAREARDSRRFAGSKCDPMTMHSLFYRHVVEEHGQVVNLNTRDVRESMAMAQTWFPRLAGWNDYRLSAALKRTLQEFCNSADMEPSPEHARAALVSAVGDPDSMSNAGHRARAEEAIRMLSAPLASAAEALFEELVDNQKITHDIYLKMGHLNPDLMRRAFAPYKRILFDEGQDANPVQIAILKAMNLPLVIVGDPYQSIYSWRGAVNALDLFEGREFHLTTSFRFNDQMAETARRILDNRPEGRPVKRLVGSGSGRFHSTDLPQIAILTRSNMGAINEAIRMSDKGLPFHFDNAREVLDDLTAAVNLFERGRVSESGTFAGYTSWDEVKAEAEDSGDNAVGRIVKIVEDGRAPMVQSMILNSIGNPGESKFTIMTAHRSKGLEFPAVRMGEDWSNMEDMAWRYIKAKDKSRAAVIQALEAYNLVYVAFTRAKALLSGHEPIIAPLDDPDFNPDFGNGPQESAPGREPALLEEDRIEI